MFRTIALTFVLLATSTSYADLTCQKLFDGKEVRRDTEVWLEKDNSARKDWVRSENHMVFEDLHKLIYKKVQTLFKKIMDVPKVLIALPTLKNKSEITLQDQGLSKPKEVVLTRKDLSREVLISTFQWSRKGTFNFVSMTISPGERFLTVTAAENGTIDDFRVIVYDLYNRKILTDNLSATHEHMIEVAAVHDTTIVWLSEIQFAVSSESGTITYDIKDIKGEAQVIETEKNDGNIIGSKGGVTLMNVNGKDLYYQIGKPPMSTDQMAISSIIGTFGEDIYLLNRGAGLWGEVIKATRRTDDPATADLSVVLPESNYVTDKAYKLDETHIALARYLGADRRIDILDLTTNLISHSFSAPPSSAITDIKLKNLGSQLELTLSSPVIEKKTFTYDLDHNEYIKADPEIEMMTLNGIRYVSEYLSIASKDGTLVPTRIVHKKDFAQDGSASGLSWTYGGFGANGYLYPSFNNINLEYLKNGGVIIAPGVRGGSEFGEPWHVAGKLDHKQNVIDDLNSVIEHLQREKYIDRKKTISTGWSNGGMVVAAAAMQRPDLYALVVPGAGVQDYLDTIKTDKRYQGWKFEYGDPYGPDRLFMKRVGPVSLAQQGKGQGPIWFYVGGTNDSRVNPSNSHKAAFAAQKSYANPSRVRRLTMKNSGHWMTSQLYQDVIAWGSQSIIWSYIFTTAGMNSIL